MLRKYLNRRCGLIRGRGHHDCDYSVDWTMGGCRIPHATSLQHLPNPENFTAPLDVFGENDFSIEGFPTMSLVTCVFPPLISTIEICGTSGTAYTLSGWALELLRKRYSNLPNLQQISWRRNSQQEYLETQARLRYEEESLALERKAATVETHTNKPKEKHPRM